MVVDPRSFDLQRAGSAQHLSLWGVAVSHHQGVALLVALSSGCIQVLGHLDFEGLGDHLPGSLTSDLVEIQ
jgi:hypothetical protein